MEDLPVGREGKDVCMLQFVVVSTFCMYMYMFMYTYGQEYVYVCILLVWALA